MGYSGCLSLLSVPTREHQLWGNIISLSCFHPLPFFHFLLIFFLHIFSRPSLALQLVKDHEMQWTLTPLSVPRAQLGSVSYGAISWISLVSILFRSLIFLLIFFFAYLLSRHDCWPYPSSNQKQKFISCVNYGLQPHLTTLYSRTCDITSTLKPNGHCGLLMSFFVREKMKPV